MHACLRARLRTLPTLLNHFKHPASLGTMRSIGGRVIRTILSIVIVAAVTFIFFRLFTVNSTTVALAFVLTILGIATKWGLTEATVSSLVAMLCFNFFFL